jgi:hypothetical protein
MKEKLIQPIIVKHTKIADRIEDDYKISQLKNTKNLFMQQGNFGKVRKCLRSSRKRTATNIKNNLYKIAGKREPRKFY